jgi:hypothetical protein
MNGSPQRLFGANAKTDNPGFLRPEIYHSGCGRRFLHREDSERFWNSFDGF